MLPEIPQAWKTPLAGYRTSPRWPALKAAVEAAYAAGTVYPPENRVFAALALTPPERVCAVILGQDPYHEPGQAMGLSFSVPAGTPLPRSLRNIYKELASDLNVPQPETGDLTAWANQGVLLLNTLLTVNAGDALSHSALGWETFTDAVIACLAEQPQPIAFVLWGAHARQKAALTASPHPRLVVESAHPSPLSASRGFFGSRPFSQVNSFLTAWGYPPVAWAAQTSAH